MFIVSKFTSSIEESPAATISQGFLFLPNMLTESFQSARMGDIDYQIRLSPSLPDLKSLGKDQEENKRDIRIYQGRTQYFYLWQKHQSKQEL
jgi:hypothetical protein